MKRILPVLMILISCSVYSQEEEKVYAGEYGRILRTHEGTLLFKKIDSLENAFELQAIQIHIDAGRYWQERIDYYLNKGFKSSDELELYRYYAEKEAKEYLEKRLDSLSCATGLYSSYIRRFSWRGTDPIYPLPIKRSEWAKYKDCE